MGCLKPIVWSCTLAFLGVALSGCNPDKKRADNAPNLDTRQRELARQVQQPGTGSLSGRQGHVSPPSPSAGGTLPKVYFPRSDAEIAAVFGSRPAPLPGTPRSVTPSSRAPSITAGAGWDVRLTREWRHIVIHHSATANGSAAAFDKSHKERGWDGLGYHFVIGNGTFTGDGQVEIGYRWTQQLPGAHAGSAEYNQHGIGICLVGDFTHARPSSRQMASLTQLVRYLQARSGIPPTEVIGHKQVKDTDCPGAQFDLAAFRASLGGTAGPAGAGSTRAPMLPASKRVEPAATLRLARSIPGTGASLP